MSEYLFTSESVSEGHPDKVADQISDAILDAILAQDKYARVAAETLVNTGLVVLAGEITTHANIDYMGIARETIRRIGYDSSDLGFDAKGCAVLVAYDKQSPDIAQGVNEGEGLDLDQGAGDQGLMFGYACDETPTLMPFPIYYAHRLVQRQSELRKDGRLPWLRPDAKSQITFAYDSQGKIQGIDAVVTTGWFGFQDDVALRVFAGPKETRIDMRSASRQGRSDLGVNRARIIDFLNRLNERLGGAYKPKMEKLKEEQDAH